MNKQQLANATSAISTVTQQLLSAHLRATQIRIFVDKNGGLAGATDQTINAYNAMLQFIALLENEAVVQNDYLGTLTQNVNSPQF